MTRVTGLSHTGLRRLLYVAVVLPLVVTGPLQRWLDLAWADALAVGCALSLSLVGLVVALATRRGLTGWEGRSVTWPAVPVAVFWGVVLMIRVLFG